MGVVTAAILIAVGASLSLGLFHLRLSLSKGDRWSHIFLVTSAMAVAAYAFIEINLYHAPDPETYGLLLRWLHLPTWVLVVSLVGFLESYLHPGLRWLGLTVCVLRTISLIINFSVSPNINFNNIERLTQIRVFGETISIPVGMPNPLMLVAQAGLLLALTYVCGITLSVWRRGERRKALTIGGSVTVLCAIGLLLSVLVYWQFVAWPVGISFFYLALVFSMGYELTRDVIRASVLATELKIREAELFESEEQLGLSAEVGNLGVWTLDISLDKFTANAKWRELYGFDDADRTLLRDALSKVHPDDRLRIWKKVDKAVESGIDYDIEFQVILPDGRVHWIESRAYVEFSEGRPSILRGVDIDITERKFADQAIHELSGRLINSREEERSRIARELHDDVSQKLAIMCLEIDLLRPIATNNEAAEVQVDKLAQGAKSLFQDVHRISHELHPATLEQLGLLQSLEKLCRDITGSGALTVEFTSEGDSFEVPNDIALCFYRVAQEALQNVVKHSNANIAKVKLALRDQQISITISDEGTGFDQQDAGNYASLGLVSMRERILSVGGAIQIRSVPGAGTSVEATVPV